MNKKLLPGTFSMFFRILLLCLVTGSGYAQIPDSTRRSIDSIRQLLPAATGKDRYELTFKLAYDLFDLDNEQAVKYGEEAFGLARELGDSAKIVRSGRIYGQLLRRVGKLEEAIGVMESILKMAERPGYEKELRFLCNALAIAHTVRGEYDKALGYNFRSLELRQENGDRVEIAIAQCNIANTFYLIGLYDRAAEFFKSSLLTDSTNSFTSDTKVGLALCYSRLNYLTESKKMIEHVISRYDGELAPITLPRIEIGLGYINLRQGSLDSALMHFQYGLTFASDLSHKAYMTDCLVYLGEIHLAHGNFDLAEQALLQSDFYAKKIGYRNGQEMANLALAKLYSKKGDHSRASLAKSTLIAIKDSSINQGVIENIYRHQFDYYQKEHKKTIATQAELLALQEKSIRYHLISNVVSWTCGFLLVITVFVLYRSNKLKKELTTQLELRVRERTKELRSTVDSLQRANLERNFMIDGITKRINAHIATFKGLAAVAALEKEIPGDFTKNVDKATDALASIVPQLARSKI